MEDALKTLRGMLEGKRSQSWTSQRPRTPRKAKATGKEKDGSSSCRNTSSIVGATDAGGGAEVVSAKEVPGPAPNTNGFAGQWLYAVSVETRRSRPREFRSLEMRSFVLQKARLRGAGPSYRTAKTALIQVAVPAMRLSSPEIAKLSLQFYKIKAGPQSFMLIPNSFQKLKQKSGWN